MVADPCKDSATFSKQKLIQLTTKEGRSIKLPYHSHCGTPLKDYQAYSVTEDVTLYPLETLNIPIPAAMQCDAVVMSLRKNFKFCEPVIQNAKKRYIQIKNDSESVVFIPKHTHLADLRVCEQKNFEINDKYNCPDVQRIYDISNDDVTHLIPPKKLTVDDKNYTDEISLDPDKQMPASWRTRFKHLCEAFTDIITPQPGRYNGAFGRTSTDINFTMKPPQNLSAQVLNRNA